MQLTRQPAICSRHVSMFGTLLVALFVTACAAPVKRELTLAGLTVDATVAQDAELTVTYLGVTTVVISDGKTNLMTDGYFSRVAITSLDQLIEPNLDVINDSLDRFGVSEAAALMVVHSHFDHALDAPVVAAKTGAKLVGSESTANVGRGLGLPESQLIVATPGEPIQFGDFEVTLLVSKHWPLPEPLASAILNQTIDAPLTPPAKLTDYKEGKSYSIIVRHPAGSLLIQGSAGYIPDALDGVQVDTVLLGTGGLGDLPLPQQEAYYHEMVETTGARYIYPIHWDVMDTPLTQPLEAASDFEKSMDFLETKRLAGGADFGLLPLGKPIALKHK